MQGSKCRPRAGRLALAAVLPVLWAPPLVVAGERTLLVRLSDPVASWIVHRSLRGAIDRLERSETCRAVLDDFTTPAGERLSTALQRRGEAPGEYLASLLFVDGSSHPRCRSGGVAAYTAPGWRVVYVCSRVFRRHGKRHAAEAEAMLIHEALHTLGLGENPPTSRAIQERVSARCLRGRKAEASTGRPGPPHTSPGRRPR